MAKRIKDTDYLGISARIRAMETGLLTQEKLEQLLEARSGEETARLLQECGYPDLDPTHPEEMDAALSGAREAVLEDLGGSVPDERFLDIFKLKYDYHNGKALLKAQAMGTDPGHMLMDMGRVPAAELREALETSSLDGLPPFLAAALAEAREVLDATRDPQQSDIVLDRWCYRDMAKLAEETGSGFLRGYVQIQIDAANLRTLVRTLRMGKGAEFLQGVLMEGGTVDDAGILAVSASGGSGLADLYAATAFREAAQSGAEALEGGPLTQFEKLCDDAVGDYLSAAQFVPFGEAPLVGYLAARETEYLNLRILLLGKSTGLDADVIRSRLRKSYV